MNRQRVQVFSLVAPGSGVAKDKRRYKVRWRVDGRDRMRAFRTKGEAERFRSQLQLEAAEGAAFDRSSGLPAEWSAAEVTWWAWSCEWLALKWPRWSGNSRRTSVESLVAFTPHLVRRGAVVPEGLVPWLLDHGYRPGTGRSRVPQHQATSSAITGTVTPCA